VATTCLEAMALASLIDPERSSRSTGNATSGAVSELIASADLMRRGYHVFRALSPSCPSDLLVYRYDPDMWRMVEALRVQVRTAWLNGEVIYFRLKESDRGKFDVLALVLNDDRVFYIPMIPGSSACPYGINAGHLQMLRSWGVLRGAGWQGMRPNLQES
jgi:hypothetical protein